MEQPYLFEDLEPEATETREEIDWLKSQGFDIRRRFYENDAALLARARMSSLAFETKFWPEPGRRSKWVYLPELAEICPTGVGKNRLEPSARNRFEYPCKFLQVRDVVPGRWTTPKLSDSWSTLTLPKRATYIPRIGDVFLSRFRQPLGKGFIYDEPMDPIYVTNNFLLLRPQRINPVTLLALLESSFLSVQLHAMIRQRTITAEMYQRDARYILLPAIDAKLSEDLLHLATARLLAEQKLWGYLTEVGDREHTKEVGTKERNLMCAMDTAIDDLIYHFLE